MEVGRQGAGGSPLSEALCSGWGGTHPGTGPCPRGRAAPRVLCAWAARTAPARIPLPLRPRRRWPPGARTPAPAGAAEAAAPTGASEPTAWRPRASCREERRGTIKPAPGWFGTRPRDSQKAQKLDILHQQFSKSQSLHEASPKPP